MTVILLIFFNFGCKRSITLCQRQRVPCCNSPSLERVDTLLNHYPSLKNVLSRINVSNVRASVVVSDQVLCIRVLTIESLKFPTTASRSCQKFGLYANAK